MRREIAWTTRLEDSTKREVRVDIVGRSLFWRFKCKGDAYWDRTSPPTPADWAILLDKAEHWYRRRALTHAQRELIRQTHAALHAPSGT